MSNVNNFMWFIITKNMSLDHIKAKINLSLNSVVKLYNIATQTLNIIHPHSSFAMAMK